MLDREERLETAPSLITPQMDYAADMEREFDVAVSVLQGKVATQDFDVFISYSDKDEEWVFSWLLPHLEKRGIYAYTDRHFDVGVPTIVNIEEAVDRCPKALLILTPDWIESEWAHFESLLMQSEDPAGLRRRILPLMLKECKTPKRLAIFTYADFTQPIQWDKELERIIRAIEE